MSALTDPTTFRRNLAATGLVAAGLLSLAWVALQPPFPAGYEDRLAAIDDGGTAAAASAALFVASQLPMLGAVLGIAHLLRREAPVLSNVGGLVAVLGCFGHAVFGGVSLVTVVMAADAGRRAEYAGLLGEVESSPVMVFAALGLLGTVLGLLLLAVGLWRARVVARWVPALLVAFLVVEFVGAGISDWASYLSGTLLLVAFGAISRVVVSRWDGSPVPDLVVAEPVAR